MSKIKTILAKLLLSKEARELGESMIKSGHKIKETKVSSLTGSHSVYELEFPKLTPQQWRDNYDIGVNAIKTNELINKRLIQR